MSTSELLQQVRILDPIAQMDRVADVLLVEGCIQAIADQITDLPEQTTVRHCAGLVLGPGLVDLYSHSGEPGFEARETLNSLAEAAIAGGFTRLTLLPDTQPVLDHPGGLELVRSRLSRPLPLQLQMWGAVTQQVQGQHLVELADLAAAGVVGFSDGYPLQNLMLVRRVLEYLQPLGKAIALWPCNLDLANQGVVREGRAALQFGLPASPVMAETAALAALLEVVAATATPVHFMRISTAQSVALIATAKAQGLPVTASTSWMHLLCDDQALASYNPNLRLDPPLGSAQDQKALINGLQSGVLDGIAVDHTPYTYEEKTVPFAKAPAGAIGLELVLPLLWQRFVATQEWTALKLWQALSTQPARCLQQSPPAIAVGQPAELTLFDPQQEWIVTGTTLKSLAHNTPWLNHQLTGRVVQTWCPSSKF